MLLIELQAWNFHLSSASSWTELYPDSAEKKVPALNKLQFRKQQSISPCGLLLTQTFKDFQKILSEKEAYSPPGVYKENGGGSFLWNESFLGTLSTARGSF